jgi:hypothetical protein
MILFAVVLALFAPCVVVTKVSSSSSFVDNKALKVSMNLIIVFQVQTTLICTKFSRNDEKISGSFIIKYWY